MPTRSRLGPLLVSLSLATVACGSNDEEIHSETTSLVLEGSATPEAFELITTTPAEDWEWAAGVPQSPEKAAVLSAGEPAKFVWTSDLTHAGAPEAESAPLTGVAFWLRFEREGAKLLDVFTTNRDYTPKADVWERLGKTSGSITLHIDSADFEANAIVDEGGPFTGMATDFTIE